MATVAIASQPPNITPTELVRQAVQNEIDSSSTGAKFMFRDRKQTPNGSQTKLMIETREAMAGMIIANDDKPLGPQQHEAELARVERFVKYPEELKKKQKQEKENSERITRIMHALPDAFVYERDGTETGRLGLGRLGDELVRLRFRPNPDYNPPSHVEQVLTGMEGTLLIDARQKRIARIDGTLANEVGFGWGILGHLDRGGHFLVEQAVVGPERWEITCMDLAFTGKVLLFKSINIKSREVFSDFRAVPSDLTFAQGVELLKKERATLAENQQQGNTK